MLDNPMRILPFPRRPPACTRTRSPVGFVSWRARRSRRSGCGHPGGGRKRLAESNPGLLLQLKAFVDPETRGDPMSLLVWTTKSTRNLADALTKLGHRVSDRTVARMLRAGNGTGRPDRYAGCLPGPWCCPAN